MSRFGVERVTMEAALAWAAADGLYVPVKGALQAINATRDDQGLPRFILGEPREREMDAEPAAAAFPEPGLIAEHIPAAATSMPSAAGITSGELADFSRKVRLTLFEEMADLRAGRATPQRSQAVAKLVQQAVAAVRLEIDFSRDLKTSTVRQIEAGA